MFSFCNITLFIFFKYTSTTATDPYGHPLSLPHALPIYISRLPCLCAAARQGEHEKRILYLELPAKRRGKLTDEAQPEPEAKRGRFKARGKARRRRVVKRLGVPRSEEHTSELQSLMRTSYAAFCLKKKTNSTHQSVIAHD